MITPDDNGYGRLKRWRERNRGLANMRQRAYREKKRGKVVGVQQREHAVKKSEETGNVGVTKVEELRKLIAEETKKAVVEVVKPLIFRDDFGRVISETQWERLQEKKRHAREFEYELDEYSQ